MNVTVHLLYVLLKFNQASHCVIIESSRKMPKDCLTGEETSFTIVRTDLMIYFSLFFRGFSLFHGRPEIDVKTCTNKPFFGLRIWIQPDPGRIRKQDFRVRPDVFFMVGSRCRIAQIRSARALSKTRTRIKNQDSSSLY